MRTPVQTCEKIELAWILFDDDDTILINRSMEDHMDSIVQDLALPFDAPSMDEPELQFITFDVEELSSLAIADVLLEIEVEKFTFQDVMNIDSSSFEPEMEIFTIDDEATSDVKEPSSTNPLTTPSLVSSVEVVLKLLSNHLRYDPSLFDKACHIIDIAYTPCDLLMTLLNGILYRYAYAIGYSIDDLEGIVPITCVLGPFRFMFLHHQLQDDLRVDIPWDPDGCMVW
uniref:Uncharacterized protein n=1 Tax=Avena sativa TaxID=4498 RepID=A0ACD5TD03_AVESA